MGSCSYPLLEISLISSDKGILARSYQNPVLFVALLSEALAGVKEEELSTLLTIINSHSELPLLLRILLPSLRDTTVYNNKPTKVSLDVPGNHLAKKVAPGKRERILADCGTEDTTWHEEAIPNHEVEKTCNRLGIKHTTTKGKHPWTNGYGEKLNKSLLDEFYAVAF